MESSDHVHRALLISDMLLLLLLETSSQNKRSIKKKSDKIVDMTENKND